MWGWKPAKPMLELLWNHGELVVAGRRGSSGSTTSPSGCCREAVLDAPTPPEPERLRELTLRAPSAHAAR